MPAARSGSHHPGPRCKRRLMPRHWPSGPDTIRLGTATFAGATDLAGDASMSPSLVAGRASRPPSAAPGVAHLLLTGNFTVQDSDGVAHRRLRDRRAVWCRTAGRVDLIRASAPSAVEEVLNYSGSSPNSLGLDDVGIQQPSGSANALNATATTINNLNIASGATGNYAVLGTGRDHSQRAHRNGAASAGIALYGTSAVAGRAGGGVGHQRRWHPCPRVCRRHLRAGG